MTIQQIIEACIEGHELSIEGVPFLPASTEEIKLSTGESIYLSYSEVGTMLGIDPVSEESYLFESCDEEMDPNEDLQVYSGRDYEFSMESEGRILVEDELTDEVVLRDYESSNGRMLRVVDHRATGDVFCYEGRSVEEEEIVEST